MRAMHTTQYLIAGGGMTADAACRGIRDFDPTGEITVVAEEPHAPYARPPLSKALWRGEDESTIWRGTADLEVGLRLGRTIIELDLEARRAIDDRGEIYAYERLLLATGGRPRRLAFGGDKVTYFRTLDDYRYLRGLANAEARFLVIGGGFIGSEIAAALAMNGSSVTMVFPEPGIGTRIFPAELSASVTDYYRAPGCRGFRQHVGDGDRAGGRKGAGGDGRRSHGEGGRGRRWARHRAEGRARCRRRLAGRRRHLGRRQRPRQRSRERVCRRRCCPFPRGRTRRAPGASSTRITPRATAGGSARTWLAPMSRMTTCHSFTPTSSTSATRRWVSSIAAFR